MTISVMGNTSPLTRCSRPGRCCRDAHGRRQIVYCQLTAFMFSGTTLVVSPLIALKKDQVALLPQPDLSPGERSSSVKNYYAMKSHRRINGVFGHQELLRNEIS